AGHPVSRVQIPPPPPKDAPAGMASARAAGAARCRGEVPERPKGHAWKACALHGAVGSNPTLSANSDGGFGHRNPLIYFSRQAKDGIWRINGMAVASWERLIVLAPAFLLAISFHE